MGRQLAFQTLRHYHYLGGDVANVSLPLRARGRIIAHLVPATSEEWLLARLDSQGFDMVLYALLGLAPRTTLRTPPLTVLPAELLANVAQLYARRVEAGAAMSSFAWGGVLNALNAGKRANRRRLVGHLPEGFMPFRPPPRRRISRKTPACLC